MDEHSVSVGVSLVPLDALFFRDGRPFEPASHAESGTPMPQTMAGAIRTWLLQGAGCDFDRLGMDMRSGASFADAAAAQGAEAARIARLRFRGPWFAVDGQPVVPVPATLRQVDHKDSKQNVRLDPLKRSSLPGWHPPEDRMLPLWLSPEKQGQGAKIERVEGYLTQKGLKCFLEGDVPAAPHETAGHDKHFLEAQDLFGYDRRTGIVVDQQSHSADEGMIYSVSLLTLKRGVSLYAEVVGPRDGAERIPDCPTPIALGGEGRRAAIRRVAPVSWPKVDRERGRNSLLLLTTPGLFEAGWRPSGLPLVAAAVPGDVAVSGWDLARGRPKANRFAVAAGSVYFLKEALAPPVDSLCREEDTAAGWGCFVEGRWDYV